MTHTDGAGDTSGAGERFGVADALDLATYASPAWNDDGTRVGYLRFADGDTRFVTRPVDAVGETALSLAAPDDERAVCEGDAAEFAWRPHHPETAAVVRDGDIVLFDATSETTTPVASADADHASPAWHPDGDTLAYVRDGSVWVQNLATGDTREVQGGVAELFGPTPLAWGAAGEHLATLVETDEGTLSLVAVAPFADGDGTAFECAPRPADEVVVDAFAWAGDALVYTVDGVDGTDREYRVASPGEDREPDTLLVEASERGLNRATLVGHDAGRLAVVAAPDGYPHVYLVDLAARREADATAFSGPGVTRVTEGAFEARGDALDAPAFDAAGDRLAYVTNEHDAGERRLHVAGIEAGEDGLAVGDPESFDLPGNVVSPEWGGGRLLGIRAGRRTPADLHVFEPGSGRARRVSSAHPDPGAFEWFPEPEPVAFESGYDGEPVYGYLYEPPAGHGEDRGNVADGDRPAVVWAHGGPMRQMRRGFHHMRSYAYFHAFNHVLVDRGYAVLELNYRGGIGYGGDYEFGIHEAVGEVDVRDCVDAAAFLRERDGVGDAVGLWGLSYGGYLASAVATKTDAFDCAVNFAGVWDWRDWVRYAAGRNWGAGRRFLPLFGAHPDDADETVAERYRVASPTDHADGIDTPLFALHGTDDPNVAVDQQHGLVSDLVERGADFESAYYPEEDHMFRDPATWEDALGRVLPFLDDHLR